MVSPNSRCTSSLSVSSPARLPTPCREPCLEKEPLLLRGCVGGSSELQREHHSVVSTWMLLAAPQVQRQRHEHANTCKRGHAWSLLLEGLDLGHQPLAWHHL